MEAPPPNNHEAANRTPTTPAQTTQWQERLHHKGTSHTQIQPLNLHSIFPLRLTSKQIPHNNAHTKHYIKHSKVVQPLHMRSHSPGTHHTRNKPNVAPLAPNPPKSEPPRPPLNHTKLTQMPWTSSHKLRPKIKKRTPTKSHTTSGHKHPPSNLTPTLLPSNHEPNLAPPSDTPTTKKNNPAHHNKHSHTHNTNANYTYTTKNTKLNSQTPEITNNTYNLQKRTRTPRMHHTDTHPAQPTTECKPKLHPKYPHITQAPTW